MERYFPGKLNSLTKIPVLYSEAVKQEILYDPSENYARKVIRQYEQMERVAWEEELILRSHVFKKAVVEIYNGRCAITGMKLEFGVAVTMVDACHIVPFAQSYDDTIHNGIALSPTLHRAFDRGMVSVSDDYRVLVHPRLRDYYPLVGIQQFNGKELILPGDSRFYPSREKLGEQRVKWMNG
ncbi:MAG TPA: HNH endonuclease [Prolixibacteraceae bacterium]